jgi:Inner membrane protein involved in colicin E2 resistance
MQKQLAIKIALIFLIALILLIPLNMISGKIAERQQFKHEAEHSIAKSWTSAQQIMTPLLVVPYETERAVVRNHQPAEIIVETQQLLVPLDTIDIVTDVNTSLRQKGIYRVPVYDATIAMNGMISQSTMDSLLTPIRASNGFQKLLPAYIALHVADGRGITGAPTITWQGESVKFKSGSGISDLTAGLHAPVKISQEQLDLNIAFQLRGMSSLQFIPAAANTRITLHSNWPHPEFIGAFLPSEHNITENGFSAKWQVNEFSNNIGRNIELCAQGTCKKLQQFKLGTNFYQAVDIYLQTERAVKYGILFIAISFATFFLFEVLRRAPIHPIQYTFVGLALAIFYLLLVSLSEHINFLASYTLATITCLILLNIYLGHVLRGYIASTVFCLALGGLYTLLYVIILMEDFALLTGSVMLLVILSIIMITTRKINWYQITQTV